MLKFPQSFLTVHLPCQISWNSEKPFFGRATYSEIESKNFTHFRFSGNFSPAENFKTKFYALIVRCYQRETTAFYSTTSTF